MFVQSLKRWHWIAISVLLGLSLGASWRAYSADVSKYGESVVDPREFESSLVGTIQGVPMFKDISVHRQQLDDGSGATRTVHVVHGKYCNGHPEPDGKYHWHGAVFLAPVPYRAQGDPWELFGSRQDVATAYHKLQSPDVCDFLSALKESRNIAYTSAWWETYPMATWLAGCVLVVGLIWPTVINLIVYNRLTRPPEPKGIDLSNVTAPAAPPRHEATEEELAHLRDLEAEMESNLTGSSAPAPAAAAPQIYALSVDALSPAAEVRPDQKAFGAGADDFYPTEPHARKPKTKG